MRTARVGHFGRSQFYFALKLIAMAQNGLPLPPSIDKINTGVEVPLPAFSSNWRSEGKTVSDPNRQMEFVNPAFIDNAPEQEVDYDYPPIKQQPPVEWIGSPGFKVGGIPPPQRNSRTGNALYQVANSPQVNPPQPQQIQQNTTTTSGSPPASPIHTSSPSFQNSTPPTSPPHTGRVLERHKSLPSSPREVPLIKERTDKNRHSVDIQSGAPSVKIPTKDKDGGWASFDEEKQAEQNNHQQAPQQQLSGDEDTSWAKFPDQSGGDQPELKHSLSIPGSEGSVCEEDVWQISTEQRTYYTNQFQRLQPEPCGLLGGAEAKGFFEKSKLPTPELSIIWQLSDVNKDGTLSLEEFCTAMHLVVLRKHSIPLPDKLPACLVPQVGAPTADEKEVPTYKKPGQEQEGKGTTEQTTTTTTATTSSSSSVPKAPRSVTPPVENNKTAKIKDENWAKFNDSPLPRPPSPSSQSPANFDFASISPDPEAKIFQPIPLHVSPSGNRSIVLEQRARTHSDPIRQDSSSDHEYDVPPPTLPEKKKRANTLTSDSSTPAKIAPPPPIEKSSRRGDSLEHALASPYSTGVETSAALPRPRSRSCSAKLAHHQQGALSISAPKQSSLVESAAEKGGDGDSKGASELYTKHLGDSPSTQYESRLRASSLDSSVYRSQFRWVPQKNLGRERTLSETIYESKPYQVSPKSGVNGTEVVQERGEQKLVIPRESGDVDVEQSSTPDVPPPLAPPPPLVNTPPMSAPPPPLRWRSASLDSRVVRSRVRLSAKELTLSESETETAKKSREDLSVAQSVRDQNGAKKDLPSFPPIAPPPGIEDIRARSASLDYKIFSRERNSELGQHLRPSIPPRPGAQKTYPTQTSKSSSVQSSSRSSSVSDSSSHSSSAEDDDDEHNHTTDFADFSKFESMTADSPTPESSQNRVAGAQYTPVDSTPRLSPPPPPPPRQQTLEDSCTDRSYDKSSFLASKERHKSGDELEAGIKREYFAHERIRHASAPDPVSSTQEADYDRKSIQAAIRRAKEENTKLSRLNSELQQELKQMMEDRIQLETQLERLRPFSSTS
ncbi:uncharacterized protein [Amphiura filiformis]|uniref:uncharacterized protein isoform X2 n=1 Tax=Amphiura filiformis TaxID=82378 RepID=UPI003B212F86